MKNEITEMLLLGTALSNCNTRQEVVDLVNASDTPENIAAAYAIGAAEEADFGFTTENFEAHLDCLEGAKFDRKEAVYLALKNAPLSDIEMDDYVEMQISQMSDEDFCDDPDSWKDGIESNHVIAIRDGVEVYCDDWPALRDKILDRLV